jgi:hypothetical protein
MMADQLITTHPLLIELLGGRTHITAYMWQRSIDAIELALRLENPILRAYVLDYQQAEDFITGAIMAYLLLGMWTTPRTPDSRIYYFNWMTGATT